MASEDVYRWSPDTAIEEVWMSVHVERLRQDLIRVGVLVPVEPAGTRELCEKHLKQWDQHANPMGCVYREYLIVPLEADDE